MRNRWGFLSTRVGRRTLTQFLGAALLPVVAVSAAGVAVVYRSLDQQATERTVRAAQAQSFLVLGALTSAGRDTLVQGVVDRLPSSNVDALAHLAGGEPLLKLGTAAATEHAQADATVSMWRRRADGQLRRVPIAAQSLWGTADEATGSASESYCVFETGSWRRVHCAPGASPARVEAMRRAARGGSGQSSVQRADGLLLAHRDLFLRYAFGSPAWRFVSSEEEAVVFEPITALVRTIVILAALAAVTAFAMAHRQIRRSTAPLEALSDAAHRMMEGDFETPVAITSDDEYGDLGRTFDVMAANLSRKFVLLRNLDAIDHATLDEGQTEDIVASALRALVRQHDCKRVAIALCGERDALAVTLWTLEPNGGPLTAGRMLLSTGSLNALESMSNVVITPAAEQETRPLADLLPPPVNHGSRLLLPLREDRALVGILAIDLGQQPAVDEERLEDLRRVADRFTLGIGSVRLIERLEALSNGAMLAFARAIDANSRWTAGHSERVTAFALRLGRQLELDDTAMRTLSRGGLMHDVGKIGIAPSVLDKHGRLTDEERHIIEQHTVIGESILSPIDAFREALPIVRSHHERWDGAGYPDGLKGEQIPWLARVLAVADVYDALVSNRPYRAGLPVERVVEIIAHDSGTHFDPTVVKAMLALRASGEPFPSAAHGAPAPHSLSPASKVAA